VILEGSTVQSQKRRETTGGETPVSELRVVDRLTGNYWLINIPNGTCAVDAVALYLRSVYLITTAFHGLRCHPLTCVLLKIRLTVDSSPSWGANYSTPNLRS